MVIVLIDGGVILPEGETQTNQLGICVTMGNAKHYIPHGQIKWVYENPDANAERNFAEGIKGSRPTKPLPPYRPKTNEELISELYK